MFNNGIESNYKEALEDIGYNLEEVKRLESGLNLGSSTWQGQISAAFLDSLTG
jgi:hypothetical protein